MATRNIVPRPAPRGFVQSKVPFVLDGLRRATVETLPNGKKIALLEGAVGGWFHRESRAGNGRWFITASANIDRVALERDIAALQKDHPEVKNLYVSHGISDDMRALIREGASTAGSRAATRAALGLPAAAARDEDESQPQGLGLDEVERNPVPGQPPVKVLVTAVRQARRPQVIPDGDVLAQFPLDDLTRACAITGPKGERPEIIELDVFLNAAKPAAGSVRGDLPDAPGDA